MPSAPLWPPKKDTTQRRAGYVCGRYLRNVKVATITSDVCSLRRGPISDAGGGGEGSGDT